jgi:Anthrone oxygenase
MLVTLEVLTVILAVVTLTPALAHALEWPGKMRLSRQHYLAVQPIYYPGFTIAGFAEPLSILATLILLVLTRDAMQFWLIACALAALVVMHLIFWLVTQPVNKFWLRDTELTASADRFFGKEGEGAQSQKTDWTRLRDRWELSHALRSIAAALALVLLVTAVAL